MGAAWCGVETEGIEPSSPHGESGILPLEDVPGMVAVALGGGGVGEDGGSVSMNVAVPTGIEPVSTLLDRQAASPDAFGTFVRSPPAANRTPIDRLSADGTAVVLRADGVAARAVAAP